MAIVCNSIEYMTTKKQQFMVHYRFWCWLCQYPCWNDFDIGHAGVIQQLIRRGFYLSDFDDVDDVENLLMIADQPHNVSFECSEIWWCVICVWFAVIE